MGPLSILYHYVEGRVQPFCVSEVLEWTFEGGIAGSGWGVWCAVLRTRHACYHDQSLSGR